jgi:hypothetical protein
MPSRPIRLQTALWWGQRTLKQTAVTRPSWVASAYDDVARRKLATAMVSVASAAAPVAAAMPESSAMFSLVT